MDPGAYEEPEGEDLFTNRPPTPVQAAMLDNLTARFRDMDAMLMRLPPSRFRSTSRRKLEECSMWAKKATVFTVHDHAPVGEPPPEPDNDLLPEAPLDLD